MPDASARFWIDEPGHQPITEEAAPRRSPRRFLREVLQGREDATRFVTFKPRPKILEPDEAMELMKRLGVMTLYNQNFAVPYGFNIVDGTPVEQPDGLPSVFFRHPGEGTPKLWEG